MRFEDAAYVSHDVSVTKNGDKDDVTKTSGVVT
jgi:hypothetical protein